MERIRTTGLATFGLLFVSMLKTLRAVNWPLPKA